MRATIALLLIAAPAFAQQQECHEGPGAPFGVTAYNCVNCGIQNGPNGRIGFIFNTEPTILETHAQSSLKPGDKIEEINGYSIKTADGVNQFTYPSGNSPTVITITRDGSRMNVEARRFPRCSGLGSLLELAYLRQREGQSEARPGRQLQFPMLLDPRRYKTDGAGHFGFALACRPSCTRARASDGSTYYKFDGYPPVVALRKAGPAEIAGLKVGDVVTHIDGKSILEEVGALPFLRSARVRSLSVTVLRDGTERTYIITVN